jgi:transposase
LAEVVAMMDDATTAPLAGPSYDGRRSGSGGRAGRGVEVRVREVRRRNWLTEERLRIVRETLEPGVIVQAVADRHGVSTGQLYTWRKQMLATAMAGFVPVEVVPDPAGFDPGGHGLDTLAIAGQQQAGAVAAKWRDAVGMTKRGAECLDIGGKPRFTAVR